MNSRFLVLFFLLFTSSFTFANHNEDIQTNRILFLAKSGNSSRALEMYRASVDKNGRHDFDLLHQIGLCILEQGMDSGDKETQIMSLFGAGISADERTLSLLIEGADHPDPTVQLLAMNLLSRYENREAYAVLNRAMSSNHLLIRLEAAMHLAEKKHAKAVSQIESLMYKVEPEVLVVFPQLFAAIGDAHAIKLLRKLLTTPNEEVRIEAILSIAALERDDLLPQIRILSSQHSMAQQEACAVALGLMKDEKSQSRLEHLAQSRHPNVRLAALQALYRLGHTEARSAIENIALSGDIYAIFMLGEMPGSEPTLAKLVKSKHISAKINAAIALLELQDDRCLDVLYEYLVRDQRHLMFEEGETPGKALKAIRLVPVSKRHEEVEPIIVERSLHIREELLNKAIELPHEHFLDLADHLFQKGQNDLVPTLVTLLEHLQTPEAIHLLKKYQQKIGAPLIRNYCNLALYRLKEEGPFADNLREWIAKTRENEIIHFRPMLPLLLREKQETYQLTAEETTRLLLESIEALAASQDDHGIDTLLDTIQFGNAKNKYALVGLLIRATQ